MGIHTLFLPVTILFTYLFLQVENIFIYICIYKPFLRHCNAVVHIKQEVI